MSACQLSPPMPAPSFADATPPLLSRSPLLRLPHDAPQDAPVRTPRSRLLPPERRWNRWTCRGTCSSAAARPERCQQRRREAENSRGSIFLEWCDWSYDLFDWFLQEVGYVMSKWHPEQELTVAFGFQSGTRWSENITACPAVSVFLPGAKGSGGGTF